jgi:hypothetical protein
MLFSLPEQFHAVKLSDELEPESRRGGIAIWWATAVAVLLIFFRYEQRKRGKLVRP